MTSSFYYKCKFWLENMGQIDDVNILELIDSARMEGGKLIIKEDLLRTLAEKNLDYWRNLISNNPPLEKEDPQ